MAKTKIRVGDHFAMSDGTTAVCTKRRPRDHYDFSFFDGDEPVGVPAFDIMGNIVREQDAGFRGKLAHRNPAKKLWIKEALKHHRRGTLHRAAHVPMGEKIPLSDLEHLAHSRNARTRKRAVLARTLRGFRRRK